MVGKSSVENRYVHTTNKRLPPEGAPLPLPCYQTSRVLVSVVRPILGPALITRAVSSGGRSSKQATHQPTPLFTRSDAAHGPLGFGCCAAGLADQSSHLRLFQACT